MLASWLERLTGRLVELASWLAWFAPELSCLFLLPASRVAARESPAAMELRRHVFLERMTSLCRYCLASCPEISYGGLPRLSCLGKGRKKPWPSQPQRRCNRWSNLVYSRHHHETDTTPSV